MTTPKVLLFRQTAEIPYLLDSKQPLFSTIAVPKVREGGLDSTKINYTMGTSIMFDLTNIQKIRHVQWIHRLYLVFNRPLYCWSPLRRLGHNSQYFPADFLLFRWIGFQMKAPLITLPQRQLGLLLRVWSLSGDGYLDKGELRFACKIFLEFFSPKLSEGACNRGVLISQKYGST